MNVLVTGGAGYIGSHAVKWLRKAGQHVVVLDNLSRGHREAIPADVRLVELDVGDTERVSALLEAERIECVMHFAAFAYVGESVEQPLKYYGNNTSGTLGLLKAMLDAKVMRLIFSSTCATYGEPDEIPITEETRQSPINPYGWSKLFSERMIRDVSAAHPEFSCAMLRYFNVAGCAVDGSLGEMHEPETHLIPVVLQAALGKRDSVVIYGDDYATSDGTCIRDYIHVEDLVRAHVMAMSALSPGDLRIYNLGIGKGYSVREIVDAAREVTGRPFAVKMGARRPGDPPTLFAQAAKVQRELGWKAQHVDVAEIIESAWRWFRDHPNGY
jgi:UDP-glucose 4-epimerase